MMKPSNKCAKFIQRFEELRLKAYPDPKTGGAPWTCGWGSTGSDIGPGTVWTREYADQRFNQDLEAAAAIVNAAVKYDGMTQGQFDAFVSIIQNVGPGSPNKDGIVRLKNGQPSTLLRKFNAGDIDGTKHEWVRWISPGSNVEKGLMRRRLAELELFCS